MISNELIEEANKIADKNIVNIVENLYNSFIDEKKNQLILEAGQVLEEYICLSIKIKKINKCIRFFGYDYLYDSTMYNFTDVFDLKIKRTKIKDYYHELKDRLKEDFNIKFDVYYWNKIKGILK